MAGYTAAGVGAVDLTVFTINISQKEGTKTRKQRKTKSKHEKRKQARLMSAR